jgi:flagellar biosynthesis protein FliP
MKRLDAQHLRRVRVAGAECPGLPRVRSTGASKTPPQPPIRRRNPWHPALILLAVVSLPGAGPPAKSDPSARAADFRINRPLSVEVETPRGRAAVAPPSRPAAQPAPVATAPAAAPSLPGLDGPQVIRSLQTVGLFALVSLAPAAVLMVTAFVRINIVLVLLRQALGSPQVPGNQVLTALALLLTALVMRPVGETVYTRAIEPYASGRMAWTEAYRAGSAPIKTFMVAQIEATHHEKYLWDLYDLAVPEAPGRADPVYGEEFPMRVVAPAFLLSEITTALVFGFFLYLPFLVVDLVVAAVLAAMGLFMMPPSLVAMPLKLILFVLADGWLRVATKLLESFGTVT